MNVFFDLRSLISKIKSGIPNYTLNIFNELVKRQDNYFIFFVNSVKPQKEIETLIKEKAKNYQIINLNVYNRVLDSSFKFLHWPSIDKIVKADVYYSPHFNNIWFEDFSKYILTVHDLSVLNKNFFSWRKNLWHWSQNYKMLINKSRFIITVSEFTRQSVLNSFKINEDKVITIHSGIDKFFYQLDSNDKNLLNFKHQYNLNKFILFVGTLEPRKNITTLIDAFNIIKQQPQFKDLKLVIVGGYGWLYEDILKKISQSNFHNDIIKWGYANKLDLLYLYNLAQVFVLPSWYEGFGFPVLEAQACGTPVIASNTSSLPEIINGSGILFNPNFSEELANALINVLINESLCKNMIQNGFQNIKRFDWSTTVDKVLNLFYKVAND
ncbi:MAG: glycosyltransferase family 4 protein [Minisyncoccia bacterium]